MALDVDAFVLKFPEFAGVDPAMLQKYLDDALPFVPADPWGTNADNGQGYFAANALALSPFGNGTALVAKDGSTTYERHWQRLCRIVGAGIRVT